MNENPEVLDNTWKKLAAEGNDTAASLSARLELLATEYEQTLSELRDLARLKLHERHPNG